MLIYYLFFTRMRQCLRIRRWDFRYLQTDHARISKRALKEKNLTWQLKAGKIERKYPKTDQGYTKAKWPTRRRLKMHSQRPTSSTQSSHLQELVPSHLTKNSFDHLILEGRQSILVLLPT